MKRLKTNMLDRRWRVMATQSIYIHYAERLEELNESIYSYVRQKNKHEDQLNVRRTMARV